MTSLPSGGLDRTASAVSTDLTGGIRTEPMAFGAGLEACQVGTPVRGAATHELARRSPTRMAEQQGCLAVSLTSQCERDQGVDPLAWAVHNPPYDLVRRVRHDFHNGRRLRGVTEVNAEAATDCAVAVERATGPPTRDAVSGGEQIVHAFLWGIDADPVQDVGHLSCPSSC